jgi:hypothetical protein
LNAGKKRVVPSLARFLRVERTPFSPLSKILPVKNPPLKAAQKTRVLTIGEDI